ncbi:unnamed protein product, partial [Prorocentrum cordatum]
MEGKVDAVALAVKSGDFEYLADKMRAAGRPSAQREVQELEEEQHEHGKYRKVGLSREPRGPAGSRGRQG